MMQVMSCYRRKITDPEELMQLKEAAKLMPYWMRKEIAASLYIDDNRKIDNTISNKYFLDVMSKIEKTEKEITNPKIQSAELKKLNLKLEQYKLELSQMDIAIKYY